MSGSEIEYQHSLILVPSWCPVTFCNVQNSCSNAAVSHTQPAFRTLYTLICNGQALLLADIMQSWLLALHRPDGKLLGALYRLSTGSLCLGLAECQGGGASLKEGRMIVKLKPPC